MLEKFKNYIKNNKDTVFVITFTLLYAIITAIIAFHHENWRDENQVWLMCKELSFIDLIKQLKYEGHPFLWFTIIYGFVKLGVSYKIVNIISWILMVSSVGLILKRAPFSKIAKVGIILSFPIMYQYVIVGRSYSLIVFLGMLICCLNENRKQHPIVYASLLGLLANTHIVMLGFVCIIASEFYLYELLINRKNNSGEENKNILIGLLVLIALGVLLILQLCGSIQFVSVGDESDGITSMKILSYNFLSMGSMLLGTQMELKGIIILVLICLFLGVGLFHYRKQAAMFILSLLYILFITCVKGGGNFYIFMTIIVPLIYCFWCTNMDIKDNKRENFFMETLIVLIGIFSITNVINTYKIDYNRNYSSAYELADYINKKLGDNVVCVSKNDTQISSLVPHLNTAKCWNIVTQKYYTYITWDKEREKELSNEEMEQNIRELCKDKKVYYVETIKRKDDFKDYLEEKKEIEPLFQTNGALTDETFIIYKLNLQE